VRRPRKPRPTESDAAPELPVTRAIAITPEALGSEAEADEWLRRMAGDPEARANFRDSAVGLLNKALHVHGAAAGDPHPRAVSSHAAVAVRIGYGSGDDLVEGRWSAARDIPEDKRRRRGGDDLSPQQRVAAVLSGKEQLDTCETLIPRARLDLDAGRMREAALQIRPGLEALLAELGSDTGSGQSEDLAVLGSLRPAVGDAANAALRGELAGDQEDAVREAILVSERVLRRRRLRAG
jgi:hypothetical protein